MRINFETWEDALNALYDVEVDRVEFLYIVRNGPQGCGRWSITTHPAPGEYIAVRHIYSREYDVNE